MKLNELIKEESIDNVSVVTNISPDNLTALVNEDFSKLNRVRALGFLVILEREYPQIELEEVREKVKEHYKEEVELPSSVKVLAKERAEESSFSLFKWFVILALVFGGWYLYSQGKLDGLLNNIQDKEKIFDENKDLESNISTADAQKVVVAENKNSSISIDTSKIETPEAPNEKSIVLTSNDANESNATTAMLNKAPVNTIQSVMKPIATTDEIKKIEEDPLFQVQKETAETDSNVTNVVIDTITINPTRGMLWFGFINIDTKKRKEFMKNVSTPFDIKDGHFLLVTGHGYVDIVSESKTLELADNKKHYFYIDKSEIKEVSKKEFRAMNGKRGW